MAAVPKKEDFLEKIRSIKNDAGYRITDIPLGILIRAQTQNSTYTLTRVAADNKMIAIVGGKLLPEPLMGNFRGSTVGGHAIKIGWIGIGMCMEIAIIGRDIITTSPVREILLEESPKKSADMVRLAEENTKKKLQ